MGPLCMYIELCGFYHLVQMLPFHVNKPHVRSNVHLDSIMIIGWSKNIVVKEKL